MLIPIVASHPRTLLIRICVLIGLGLFSQALLHAQVPAATQQTLPAPSADVQKLLDAGTKALTQQPPQIEEARKQFESARALAEQDHDAPGAIASWRGLARVEQQLQHFPVALADFQKALDLCRASGDRAAEAKTLGGIGNNTYLAGDPVKAQQFWEQAVKIYQALGNQAESAGFMMNIGIVYDNTGNPRKAIQIYEQVLPIFTRLKNTQSLADTLTNIAIAWDKLDETRKALDYWQRALPLYQQLKAISGEANVLSGIGTEYDTLGARARAQQYYARALTLYQSIGDRRGEAGTLLHIAGSLREAGELERALEVFTRGVAIAHEVQDPRREASAVSGIAIVYDRMGRFAEAIRAYQQAIPLYQALSDRDGLAGIYNNMGFAYSAVGQQDQAMPLFQQALPLFHEVGDRNGEVSAINGIAGIYRVQRDPQRAIDYYNRAMKISHGLGDLEVEATLLSNIGIALHEQNKNEAALKALHSTLALLRRSGDLNLEANTLNTIGIIYEEGGELHKARETFLRALVPARASGNRGYLGSVLNNLGNTEKRLGLLALAEAHLAQAVALVEQVRTDFDNLTEAQSHYLADNLKYYHDYLDILIRSHRPEKAFEVTQQTKARSLRDLLEGGRVDVNASLTPEERAQETALEREADRLNLAMVREGVQNEVGAKKRFAALKEQLRETESRLRTLMDGLYARHPDLQRRRPAQIGDWRTITAAVPADTALLDYVVLSDSRLLLFVVTRTAKGPVVRTYPIVIRRGTLGKLTSAWVATCTDPRRSYREQAIQLGDLLIGPAAADLVGKRRLVICPDGALWDVPFQALLTPVRGSSGVAEPGQGRQFLVDAFEIAYAYSADSLRAALALRDSAGSQPAQNSILVFADPDFGGTNRFGDNPELKGQRPLADPSRPLADPSRPLADPSRPLADPSRPLADPSRPLADPSRGIAALLRGGKIPALPGTRREAQALMADFPDATVYLGAQAQEDICKRLASEYRYLHFATHGFFNDAAPMLSSIVLAQPAPGSPEDGFLTAREVADLKLNADLVVLSACNTARGERRAGEGVVGLTWALFVAGAKAQVVSQWSVDDISTAMLMQRFYAGLTAGKQSKSAALRSAELALRKSPAYHHPYYWAPFILLGDWR